jgi:hypothetical protein
MAEGQPEGAICVRNELKSGSANKEEELICKFYFCSNAYFERNSETRYPYLYARNISVLFSFVDNDFYVYVA